MTGLTYLRGPDGTKLTWAEVTRDERFFCAHLYKAVLARPNGVRIFVELINQECKPEVTLDPNANWEMGFEVCLYRDLRFFDSGRFGVEELSLKRTFDFCLFSDETIVIIEAKVYQPFDLIQTREFCQDKYHIQEALKLPVKVVLVPLASSLYRERFEKSAASEAFGCRLLTWDATSKVFSENPVVRSADEVYGRRPSRSNRPGKHYMTGEELIKLLNSRKVKPDSFWVGRGQGIKRVKEDLDQGIWRDRPYEISDSHTKPSNKNWFSLAEFVETIGAQIEG